jgi:hypothetical protein
MGLWPTFKKILGAAVSAMLVAAPVAATAAQPVRPAAALVSGNAKGIQSGIRASGVKKGDSSAIAGLGLVFFVVGFAGFIFAISKVVGDGDGSPG